MSTAVLRERVQVRSDDGLLVCCLVVFDDVENGRRTQQIRLESGELCAVIDAETWRVEKTGQIVHRIKP